MRSDRLANPGAGLDNISFNMVELSIENDDAGIAVKIASDGWEINIHGTADEFAALANIENADWASRGSIAAGRSANALVHWSFDGKAVWLLVGRDDETWDFGVEVPLSIVEELVVTSRAHS